MGTVNWESKFKEHKGFSQMGVVMLFHHISFNELYPYFKLQQSKELIDKELYQCQKDIPLLNLEELTNYKQEDKQISITVNFNSSRTKFSYDDIIILDNLDSIINEMYNDESQAIHLKTTFEERDFDGVTKTQWDIVNSFLDSSNEKIEELISNSSFKEDFKYAYQQYFLGKTKEITQSLNIEFDNKIFNVD